MAIDNTGSNEAQIRELIEQRVQAVRAKDVDGAVSMIVPDIISFDVINPLRNQGADASQARLKQWFDSFEGPMDYELRDLSVVAGEDVAFSSSLNQVQGTKLDGGKLEMWWRATTCFHKIDRQWKVVHEHASVPFDPQTGQASFDLQP
jgi:ketosteroid isomerase-like protein